MQSEIKTKPESVPSQAGRIQRLLSQPALITLVVLALVVAWVILQAGGDPLALARLGTRFSQADPGGTEGYDGQFIYYIGLNPDPQAVAPLLDVPAYRYQRILLPLLGWVISMGDPGLLPWVLAVIGLLTQAAGTWAVGELLAGWGIPRGYALVYGLWAGFVLAVRLDLPEPLAFALVAGALLAMQRNHPMTGWVLYALALFAKEVTMFFVAAQILADLSGRRWRNALALFAIAGLPYFLFQFWLWRVFGQPGLGSGGAMATPFEWIPFMGILRIGAYSWLYLIAMLLVFGPAVLFPAIWGMVRSLKTWLTGERNVIVFGLFLNAAVIPFLPFSTFRETGGLLRFSCGLVLAVLLFAGRYQLRRALNYSVFWIVLNVFLLK
jgi:hypothetical protein